MTPEDLLETLGATDPENPAALLRAASTHRQALTEPLLAALAAWVAKTGGAESEWEDEHTWLADFALYLLAQFREPRAFPLYLRLCRLSEDDSEYWNTG